MNTFMQFRAFCLGLVAFTLLTFFGQSFVLASDPLIFLPYQAGTPVYTVQAPGGSFSHQGSQQYSYDFFIRINGRDVTMGYPVHSPVTGEIVEIRRGVRDNQNNSVSNSTNNYGWGNTIVIATEYEGRTIYVRLAHLKFQSTLHLNVGDFVEQGERLGDTGNTGYSTSAHMHIQVQNEPLGASVPFHFVEGNSIAGQTTVSRLERNLDVVDNYGHTNAGSMLSNASTTILGAWTYYLPSYPTVKTYAVSTASNARYRWLFTLPRGGYSVYASCKDASSRTSQARYEIAGNGVSQTVTKSFDQRRLYTGSSPAFAKGLYPLGTISTGLQLNQVQANVTNQAGTGRLCADALFIKRRW